MTSMFVSPAPEEGSAGCGEGGGDDGVAAADGGGEWSQA